MSKPRHLWWGYAKNAIRAYPRLKEAYNDSVPNAGAQELSGMPHSTGTNRTVENHAIRLSSEHKVYHAVNQAIEYTKLKQNGKLQLDLIDMMYWKEKHKNLDRCANELHISYRTARRYNTDFITLVGYNLVEKMD